MGEIMFENFTIPQSLHPSDPRFGVGPSRIPMEHLEKLAATGTTLLGTSHRKDAVKNVVKEIQEGLLQYLNVPQGYEVVLGNGGATFVWDMIGLGLVEKSSVHFTCGEFSEKWLRAHQIIPWIQTHQVKVAYGEGINPVEVDGHDVICVTQNETSTGVMISSLPELKNKNTLIAVDATSGAGQIDIDLKKVDVFYFSPQKVFAAEGGLYVAILSPKAIARAQKLQADKSRFIPESMKWSHAIENGRGHQTYNTPAIANLFLLNEQLKLMRKVGFATVIKQAQEKADWMYGWAESKPYLSCFVKNPSFRSTAVATIDMDEKYSADALALRLRKLGVAIDIDGYRKLGRNQLRIGLFHNVALEDLKKLTKIIDLAVESL
jgi:phosphoserine aminotransferase